MDPVTVAELFALLVSLEVVLTDALLEKVVPGVKLEGADTTRLKVSELPPPMLAVAVSVAVPANKSATESNARQQATPFESPEGSQFSQAD